MNDGLAIDRAGYWRAILDAVEQPIVVTNSRGVIAEFNAAAERLTGYAASEVVGQLPLTSLYDGRQIAARARQLSLERGEWLPPSFDTLVAAGIQSVPEREWTLVRKDGRRLAVTVGWRLLRGVQGKLEACVVLPSPLTQATPERHRAGLSRPSAARREPLDAQATSACFAPADALRRLNGDSVMLAEVAGLFLRERAALVADIRRAVEARDPRAVGRGAHRLRSALLNLAAGPAAEAALELEDGGRQGCLPQPAQLTALMAEVERLSDALSRFHGVSP